MHLYQQETEKALENFSIDNKTVSIVLVKAIVQIKLAAIRANKLVNNINSRIVESIEFACLEILKGGLDSEFVTSAIQGGAGTSINMNVNEVIASIATKHSKVHVDPTDHVNLSQSTNDVIPTAIRIVAIDKIKEVISSLELLRIAFAKKGLEFKNLKKAGRTHLQDAVPMTLGQEFSAYSSFVKRDIKRLKLFSKRLVYVNLGGTAIGTGVNASLEYRKAVIKSLIEVTGIKLKGAADLIDSTQNIDEFYELSAMLKTSAIGISKICSDIRLLASGPQTGFNELKLKELQNGSTIMPGKVNPVIFELMNQVSFKVSAFEHVSELVYYHGQLELNVMLPIYIDSMIDSFNCYTNAIKLVVEKGIRPIKANVEQCAKYALNNIGQNCPKITKEGYKIVEKRVKGEVKSREF